MPTDCQARGDRLRTRRCFAGGLKLYFPEADGPVMALHSCIFTNTPDEHFIIDTLPGQPEVVVASPCSGHGYKFAWVIGEILADLAQNGETRHDIGLLRLSRFAEEPMPACGNVR